MVDHLWLLRHGEAIPHHAKPDAARELTPRGELQARAAGRALGRLGVELSGCFASPKVRARDTARLACEALGVEPMEDASLAAGFDVDAALALLDAVTGDGPVLAVGHEPDFSQVVYDLTGARVAFPKGALALVEPRRSGGRLLALLRPRELEALAAGSS